MRLAYGVLTGSDQRVWNVRGEPEDGGEPGSAVVVGPVDGDPGPAVAELSRLITAGGVAVAGAGVHLSGGFVSARLDGARGDRRDAVLAALRVLGLDGLAHIGDRAGVLVALFGPEATKPVGAAAVRAIAEGRWSAVELASAASGLLTPEQVERLLTLDGVDLPLDGPVAGAGEPGEPRALPSVMGEHLGRVLGGFPSRRRLELMVDLWRQVAAERERERRGARLRRAQAKIRKVDELNDRYQRDDDDAVLRLIKRDLGHEPTLLEAVRWTPEPWQYAQIMQRALADALAATALARTAIAVFDHGVQEGRARSAALLSVAAGLMDPHEAGQAARRVPGLVALPARPGRYVRDLARERDFPDDYVRQRVARARDYGEMLLNRLPDLLESTATKAGDWCSTGLREWRAAAGYGEARPPASWTQPPLGEDGLPSLADRLTADPGKPPEEVENVADLLWLADLADVVAQLHGYEAAYVRETWRVPYLDVEPPEPETLIPRPRSAAVALAGAAQLASLGGRPPRQCRTWAELTAGLAQSMEVAQATTEAFTLPEPLAAADGKLLPGTRLRVECARNPRMLAQWSAYMGNCIAEDYYLDEALKGRCVLVALRDENGRIQANLELRRRHLGWQVEELRGRFNAAPEEELRERVRRWAATLPSVASPEPVPARLPDEHPAPRRRRSRLFPDVSGPLSELAATALTSADVRRALTVLGALRGSGTNEGAGVLTPPHGGTGRARDAADSLTPQHGGTGARGDAEDSLTVPRRGTGARGDAADSRTVPHGGGDAATAFGGDVVGLLTALRRMSAERLEQACLAALPEVGLAALWRATGVRPLARALEDLDPELTGRYERLALLLEDAPLPGTLRKLARHETIAPARAMELVARRVRAAVGRLARAGDPVLARQVARRSDTPVLCALVIAATSWGLPGVTVTGPGDVTVPGYPVSTLDDPAGPWQRALPGAAELGADLGVNRKELVVTGLRVPAAWLDQGGWPVLWQRAARNAHR